MRGARGRFVFGLVGGVLSPFGEGRLGDSWFSDMANPFICWSRSVRMAGIRPAPILEFRVQLGMKVSRCYDERAGAGGQAGGPGVGAVRVFQPRGGAELSVCS